MHSESSPRAVVVVVDDPVTRSLLRDWLEEEAFHVVEADALERAPSPELVCLELAPGQVERLELLGRLCAQGHTVVVLTFDPGRGTGLAAMRAGAYDHVAEPLDREKLLVALTRASERVSLLARVRRAEAALPSGSGAVRPLRDLEREAIAHALEACGGNVARAAKLLGLGRATLYRRLAELQIP